MAQARGIRSVGYFDCPGGGQVVVSGTTAYIAHMKAPHGTTIVDVSDPANPRKLAEITIPADIHSHKVRVMNEVMLVNREAAPRTTPAGGVRGGLGIFDVSRPDKPRSCLLRQASMPLEIPSLGTGAEPEAVAWADHSTQGRY